MIIIIVIKYTNEIYRFEWHEQLDMFQETTTDSLSQRLHQYKDYVYANLIIIYSVLFLTIF